MMSVILFLFGIILGLYISPVLDSINAVILNKLEVRKAKYIKLVTSANVEIQRIQDDYEKEEVHSNVIGFEAPSEYYYIDEDDEYEEDKVKNPIGF